MATLGDIAVKARALTHADTVSYPAVNLLVDINLWYQKVVSMILESQDDSDFDDQRIGAGGSAGVTANYPIVTTPLVAGQRDYSIPVSETVLKIKRVDITYNNTDWYRATPFDDGVPAWGMGNTTTEDINFIKQAPQYDVKYNSLFIYPLATAADVAAGAKIRVEWDRNVIPFTTADYTVDPNDSTQIPGFDPDFHHMLSYGAAYEYANANNLPQLGNIKQDLLDWEARLRTAYGRKDLDTQMAFQSIFDNYGAGWWYGSNYGR